MSFHNMTTQLLKMVPKSISFQFSEAYFLCLYASLQSFPCFPTTTAW